MNNRQFLTKILAYLGPHRKTLGWASLASISNKILDLMPPVLVGWVVDTLGHNPPKFLASVPGLNVSKSDIFEMTFFLSVLAVFVFIFESLFQWLYQRLFLDLAQKIQHSLRLDTYRRVQDKPLNYFDLNRTGDIQSIINDDVNQLERFLGGGFNTILQMSVLFAFSGVVLFDMHWRLALIGLIPVPMIVFGSFIYQRIIGPRYKRVRAQAGLLNSRLENNISGMQVIKSFTAEKHEMDRVGASSAEFCDAQLKANHLRAMYVPLIRMAIALGFGVVLLYGGWLVINRPNELSIGNLVLFSMLIQRILWPLTGLGMLMDEMEKSKASANRVFGLLDAGGESENIVSHNNNLQSDAPVIAFDNVSFQYRENYPVLKDLSINIKAGKVSGFAGSTGSGKSTLLKLLMGFYNPTSGQILIDGKSITEIGLFDTRKMISLVSQDVYVFHGTIQENILYGNPDASGDEVIGAAKKAMLWEFIQSLPEKMDTIIGERGLRLSGGQRQRLSIARAILKDAPVMIFDEATSSVDTETEREIQANLYDITRGKTALVVAHRLSTIRQADQIFVIENGELLEQGSHDQLVAKNGKYADLWNVQIGETSLSRR